MRTGPSGTTLYYDPLLRLFQVNDTSRFGYDGLRMTGEYTTSNALTKRYVYGAGGDEPLVWYEGAGTSDRRWLHADERGSVIAVTDGSGATIGVNSYDEYGVPASGNIGRFQYTGQSYLPELGLYYYKARIYSSRLGRFMQSDPIGYGDGMNWYNYAGGDSVNHTDPTGTEFNACDFEYCQTIYVNGGETGYFAPSSGKDDGTIPTEPGDIVDISQRIWVSTGLFDGLGGLLGMNPGMELTPGNDSLGGGTGGSAPQNAQQPSTLQCVGSALWDNKGVLALDALSVAASFVPGGKGLVTAGAAVVGPIRVRLLSASAWRIGIFLVPLLALLVIMFRPALPYWTGLKDWVETFPWRVKHLRSVGPPTTYTTL